MGKGFVYVLRNRSFPHLLKIGMTERSPEERAKQLSNTSVPTPYQVAYEIEVDDCAAAERNIHAELSEYRFTQDREFFEIEIEDAIKALKKHACKRNPAFWPSKSSDGSRHKLHQQKYSYAAFASQIYSEEPKYPMFGNNQAESRTCPYNVAPKPPVERPYPSIEPRKKPELESESKGSLFSPYNVKPIPSEEVPEKKHVTPPIEPPERSKSFHSDKKTEAEWLYSYGMQCQDCPNLAMGYMVQAAEAGLNAAKAYIEQHQDAFMKYKTRSKRPIRLQIGEDSFLQDENVVLTGSCSRFAEFFKRLLRRG
ncbi:MAG: GIY-YIG nuclease family protein [Syntrophorhabdus sp.]